MDKDLHKVSKGPFDINQLSITYSSEANYSTFIFEPNEFVRFETAWNWQKNWQASLLENPSETQAVWILQHANCYTLGRGAKEENLLFDLRNPPYPLHHIDRGGEVTYHLPGQLVVYLAIDLRRYQTDLNWYLRQLEEVILDVLQELGLSGKRLPGLTGVWVETFKVASIGISCRRWITQHGLSLNIDCDLNGFQAIVPCGLDEHPIGRLSSWIPGLSTADVQPLMKKCLSKRFRLNFMSHRQT